MELGTEEQAPLHHHILMHHNQPIQPTEMPAQPELTCTTSIPAHSPTELLSALASSSKHPPQAHTG